MANDSRTVPENDNWCHLGIKWLHPIGPNPSRLPFQLKPHLTKVHQTFTPYVFPIQPDVSTPMHMDGP